MSFWQQLKKEKTPFICLAPMSDVTDVAFRRMIAKYGKADVMWTEFVSADGLCSVGRKKLLHILKYSEKERPIVAQIFGANPEKIAEAVKLVKKLKFDGVDINMGCPDRAVVKAGAGSALIKNPKLAREIIRMAKMAAGSLPVSVKTRVGFASRNELSKWLAELLAEEPAAITLHARTKKEMSEVPADWSLVKKAVEIRNKLKSKTLIIGNGDVLDLADAKKKAKESGADGVMIGRGFFGKPWLLSGWDSSYQDVERNFSHSKSLNTKANLFLNSQEHQNRLNGENNPQDRKFIRMKLKILLEHTKLFEKLLGKEKPFNVMKKHFKAYVSGFDGAKELRIKLMETKNAEEVEEIIKRF
ncbi:MAG: tRNA-dihydrouridine synthase [Candidatus Paceibacterota bacterium]|jgi:nifR3 family TIM-barrel protein